MSELKLNITMSLDGYVAGPDQSLAAPLGIGGEQLHGWLVPLEAFRESHGEEGGEVNAGTPSPRTSSPAPARPSWAGTCSAAALGRGTTIGGRAGGATIRRSTIRCSSSHTIPASRSR